MRWLNGHLVKLALISVGFAACGFSPGPAGEGVTSGGAASSGNSSGSGSGGGGGGTLVITGVGLNGGGGDVTGGGGSGATCGVSTNPVMPSPPDILLVQDKSASMNNGDDDKSCGNGCASTKWTQLTTAIGNVIQATDTTVNWGLKYFSDNNACDASMAPAVPIAPMSGAAVTRSIQTNKPGGNTPTRDAITYGAQYLSTVTDTNPKFLLLATDGLPNCPMGCATQSNPQGMCTTTDNPDEDAAAEAAVTMAAMMGYQTFVIGIGSVTAAENTLNQLAMAGGRPQTGGTTSYYAATDEASLEAALMAIVSQVASCTIVLPADSVGQTNVAVSVDDASGKASKVPEDPNNGWSFINNGMGIQLNGSYCDGVKAKTYSNVQFLYSCAGPPICIDKLANGTCGD
ncbi:MAG TPA: vWA domain-containing protein [Polyangia bacterium]|jgi:hypothetical protein